MFAALTLAGCRHRAPVLDLHYLPGFVPGTRNVFAPVIVAIAPPGGLAVRDRLELGAVIGPDASVERKLYAGDLQKLIADGIARALADAGLRPVLIDAMPPNKKPPGDAEFLLVTALEDLRTEKRFGAETTVHGRYFTMHSRAAIGVKLLDAGGRELFSGTVTGVEDEPPAPVGGEVFLPLETDPAESLSVALSRAIGAIILEPGIRRAIAHS